MPEPAAPPTPTLWTIKALLDWTGDFFVRKGISTQTAKLEARIVLAHVLQCKPIDLLVRYNEQPDEKSRATFRELILRRADGWPVAYLVGQREFYLLTFEVSPAVLDLGTGSGCIAVSIAHQKKDARVTAVDVSPDALDIARRNAGRHDVADRIDFRQGDLFAAVPADSRFDLIVSNPPYVTPGELAGLAPEVRDHEPRLALDGGPDGLAFYRRIAMGTGAFLKSGGWLLAEIGAAQDEAVRGLFGERPDFEVGKTIRDAAGLPRIVVARKR
jgi:release factor glutamine methyltransferase